MVYSPYNRRKIVKQQPTVKINRIAYTPKSFCGRCGQSLVHKSKNKCQQCNPQYTQFNPATGRSKDDEEEQFLNIQNKILGGFLVLEVICAFCFICLPITQLFWRND